ncbi:hypothetical protein JK359_12935 [Streptomyces actinomycinicus]|uniref:Uncharacterized protein n=1 Tax=Streptomyces actinomycinicus TaxID=1695166 RepID=A0A937EIP0_9ACTN|nr:hypothetical protein [Streptomyces actinomycinicus]MBL1082876.1 hypothetical protein [Streptomyces actinomycinicus]
MSPDPALTEPVGKLLEGRAVFLARAVDRVAGPDEREDLAKAVEPLERLAAADLSDGGTNRHYRLRSPATPSTTARRTTERPRPPGTSGTAARAGLPGRRSW